MGARLTALDAAFLELEELDEGSHMHIGWVLVFEPLPEGRRPDFERLRKQLDVRLEALPRFRSRLSATHTGGMQWPSWVPDERFDVDAHVRRAVLPAPGDDAVLNEWLGDYWSHRLDRTRPLWEMTLLEGLEGGRWGIATKTHHCMVDGVSGVDLTYALMDAGADGTPFKLPQDNGNGDAAGRHLPAPISAALHAPATLAGGVRSGADAVLHPRATLDQLRRLGDALVRDELLAAPATSLSVPIGPSRRYTSVAAHLDDLRTIKGTLGGTVNDAALAVVTGALRRFLEQRGEPLPERPLRAMVPVSIRDAGDHGTLGNRVSTMFVDLPVGEPDAIARYQLIREREEALKFAGQAGANATLVDIAGFAPPLVHALLMRVALDSRLFTLTVTNVPGSPVALYSMGARVESIHPYVPILRGHALGISIVSYAGSVTFGLSADHASVPDLGAFAGALRESLAELKSLAWAPA